MKPQIDLECDINSLSTLISEIRTNFLFFLKCNEDNRKPVCPGFLPGSMVFGLLVVGL